jgi:hypothetical protein
VKSKPYTVDDVPGLIVTGIIFALLMAIRYGLL